VSSTLRAPDWHDSTVVSGDIIDEVTRLKQRSGGAVYSALQPAPFEVGRVEVTDGKDTIRGT
jgi:hypothetical protein